MGKIHKTFHSFKFILVLQDRYLNIYIGSKAPASKIVTTVKTTVQMTII